MKIIFWNGKVFLTLSFCFNKLIILLTYLLKIAQYCKQGGRLVCVELSGQKQSAGMLASIGGKSEGKNSGNAN